MTELLLAALAVAAPSPEPVGPAFKTPQAVYDAHKQALEKKDYRTHIECIAQEAWPEMAGALASQIISMRALSSEDANRMVKVTGVVLRKFGLDDKAIEEVALIMDPVVGPYRDRKALGKKIRRHQDFLVEMLKAMDEGRKGMLILPPLTKPELKLEGLKIDGKKASGFSVTRVGKYVAREKVGFILGAGGWRIVPTFDPAAAMMAEDILRAGERETLSV